MGGGCDVNKYERVYILETSVVHKHRDDMNKGCLINSEREPVMSCHVIR